MSSRGRSPSPRSITSSARGRMASNEKTDKNGDIQGDRSVSRGRDGKPKSRSPSRSRGRSASRSRSRSRSRSNASMRSRSRSASRARSRSRSIPPPRVPKDSRNSHVHGKGAGWRVVIVSGLTKNVRREHLEEIFSKYGRVTGLDLPTFPKCKYLVSAPLTLDCPADETPCIRSRTKQRQGRHRVQQLGRCRNGSRSHGSRSARWINLDRRALGSATSCSGTSARQGARAGHGRSPWTRSRL